MLAYLQVVCYTDFHISTSLPNSWKQIPLSYQYSQDCTDQKEQILKITLFGGNSMRCIHLPDRIQGRYTLQDPLLNAPQECLLRAEADGVHWVLYAGSGETVRGRHTGWETSVMLFPIWKESGEWCKESIWEVNYEDGNNERGWNSPLAIGGTVLPTLISPNSWPGGELPLPKVLKHSRYAP